MRNNEVKRLYTEPQYEIEKFTLRDVVTTSSQDPHDQPVDPDENEF